MSLVRFTLPIVLLFLAAIGCQVPPGKFAAKSAPLHIPSVAAATGSQEPAILAPTQNAVSLAAYQNDEPPHLPEVLPVPAVDVMDELSLDSLIDEVLTVHPSIEAMYAAWQAAADRYPQVVSLDDPMFGATFAPASFNSANVESAYALELSQKLPWPGKRALRGVVANAEAGSADRDVETTRQKLTEVATLAYWDYYLTRRQLDLNQQSVVILQAFRKNAENRYQTGLVTSQDVFQADIELANLEQSRIELERMDKVAVARINILLRRSPLVSLPPPPSSIPPVRELPDQEFALAFAVDQRPEIAAAAARLEAAQAKLSLAYKDYYPDTELFGRYDTFWQPGDTQSDLRGQVGIRFNVPIYRRRLNAAACAAEHDVTRARAEFEELVLEAQSDVQSAYEQVRESQRTLGVYSQKLLPAAEQNVNAAGANYDTAKINFLDLAMAQNKLVEARERQLQAQVELQRRFATLRRVAGGSLPENVDVPVPPPP